jgi:hypothetical protein
MLRAPSEDQLCEVWIWLVVASYPGLVLHPHLAGEWLLLYFGHVRDSALVGSERAEKRDERTTTFSTVGMVICRDTQEETRGPVLL